jgi:hypothetical protein
VVLENTNRSLCLAEVCYEEKTENQGGETSEHPLPPGSQ